MKSKTMNRRHKRTTRRRAGRSTPIQSMGHHFGPDSTCENHIEKRYCRRRWEEHQDNPRRCTFPTYTVKGRGLAKRKEEGEE